MPSCSTHALAPALATSPGMLVASCWLGFARPKGAQPGQQGDVCAFPSVSAKERLEVTTVHISPRSEELLVHAGQSLADLKPKAWEFGGGERLVG